MSAARPLTPTSIDRQQVAHEFKTHLKGKLEPAKIDAAAKSLVAETTAYPATGWALHHTS